MYNIGQIPGCLYWGWHADHFGRKHGLILVTICRLSISTYLVVDGLMMIAFGFCTNFYVAITFRFLWGMSDGYLGICKTILSEICSPDMLPLTTGMTFVGFAIAR